MSVDYWLLSIALLLLWYPRTWLRFGARIAKSTRRRRPAAERDPRDTSVRLDEELLKVRNWVDFLRAGAGAVAICKVALVPEAGSSAELKLIVLGVQVVVLSIAMAIQTIRLEKGFKLFAPLFFALGLGFGLLSWQAAAFACITLLVVNLVLPSSSVFLFALAGTQLCYGMLFHCGLKPSVLAAMVTAVPLLVSGATRRRLAQFSKKTK